MKYKKGFPTHHAFTTDANIHAVSVALGAILYLVRQLDHDCFFAIELQGVGGITRQSLFDGHFLS